MAPGRQGRMSCGRKHSGWVHRFQLPRTHTCSYQRAFFRRTSSPSHRWRIPVSHPQKEPIIFDANYVMQGYIQTAAYWYSCVAVRCLCLLRLPGPWDPDTSICEVNLTRDVRKVHDARYLMHLWPPAQHGGIGVVEHRQLLAGCRPHGARVQHLPLQCPPLPHRSRLRKCQQSSFSLLSRGLLPQLLPSADKQLSCSGPLVEAKVFLATKTLPSFGRAWSGPGSKILTRLDMSRGASKAIMAHTGLRTGRALGAGDFYVV